jgi:Activator of Hsp90 ATPase homolog 1-like protein
MKKQNYNATIVANASAKQAVKAINNVAGWWTENIEGSTEKLNDVFTVHFGETFATFKVIEVVPEKKIVWLVTDCYLHWLNDKTEWKDTKISFEILAENDETKILFTHIGLSPEIECYNDCRKGWDQYIKDSLFKLITEGNGMAERKKMETA